MFYLTANDIVSFCNTLTLDLMGGSETTESVELTSSWRWLRPIGWVLVLVG